MTFDYDKVSLYATIVCFLQTVMPVTLHVGNLKVIDIALEMQTIF